MFKLEHLDSNPGCLCVRGVRERSGRRLPSSWSIRRKTPGECAMAVAGFRRVAAAFAIKARCDATMGGSTSVIRDAGISIDREPDTEEYRERPGEDASKPVMPIAELEMASLSNTRWRRSRNTPGASILPTLRRIMDSVRVDPQDWDEGSCAWRTSSARGWRMDDGASAAAMRLSKTLPGLLTKWRRISAPLPGASSPASVSAFDDGTSWDAARSWVRGGRSVRASVLAVEGESAVTTAPRGSTASEAGRHWVSWSS